MEAEIINLLRRRPCTVADIAKTLGMKKENVAEVLEDMEKAPLFKKYMAARSTLQAFCAAGREHMSNIVDNLLDKLGRIKKKGYSRSGKRMKKKRLQKFLQLKITARK